MDKLIAEFPELFEKAFDVSIPAGWYEAARRCCAIVVAESPEVRVAQLKEKFGGARFYYDGFASQVAIDAIAQLERETFSICQLCGAPAASRTSIPPFRTVKLLCDGCSK